jgi:hypothetical protein
VSNVRATADSNAGCNADGDANGDKHSWQQ